MYKKTVKKKKQKFDVNTNTCGRVKWSFIHRQGKL